MKKAGKLILFLVTVLLPAACNYPELSREELKKLTSIPVTGVKLNRSSTSMAVGSTMTLTAAVLPADATNKHVTWTSSSTATATVDNDGKVAAMAPGSATITVTTDDGKKTATCNLVIPDFVPIAGIEVDGVEWAAYNVDDYQTFAVRPDMYTKFYQFNRAIAWPTTGDVTNWPSSINENANWTTANNPCPTGWRVPTRDEWMALGETGSSWADAGVRGNQVAGRFYGHKHTVCSLPNNMDGCIFLPAVGYRNNIHGSLGSQGSYGYYWSSTQSTTGSGYYLYFTGGYSFLLDTNKEAGLSVRCVKK